MRVLVVEVAARSCQSLPDLRQSESRSKARLSYRNQQHYDVGAIKPGLRVVDY